MKLFIFLGLTIAQSSAVDFHYHGAQTADDWPVAFPEYCNGTMQSPIDIDTSMVVALPDDVGDLVFGEGYGKKAEGTFENNGHSVQFTLDDPGEQTVSGGPLNATYALTQFHFHWGSADAQGSEHTIDGKRFPLELHLVHIKEDYLDDSDSALDDPEGYTVIGVVFDLVKKSKNMKKVLKKASAVSDLDVDETTSATVNVYKDFNIENFILGDYYFYRGGFTTPLCYEIANWIFLSNPVEISAKALDFFRSMVDEDGNSLVDNFRPVQPLNGRTVYRSF